MCGEHSSNGKLFHRAGLLTGKLWVAVACPCSWNVKLMQVGGPEVGTAGAVCTSHPEIQLRLPHMHTQFEIISQAGTMLNVLLHRVQYKWRKWVRSIKTAFSNLF